KMPSGAFWLASLAAGRQKLFHGALLGEVGAGLDDDRRLGLKLCTVGAFDDVDTVEGRIGELIGIKFEGSANGIKVSSFQRGQDSLFVIELAIDFFQG